MNPKAHRARKNLKWIAGAIKHPGALHRQLHVPDGKKISVERLKKAAHSEDKKLRARANLALTLRKLRS